MVNRYSLFAGLALLLALSVILLGAYTRLNDAGLGCPDWPGCYGKLVLPKSSHALNAAQQTFPQQPLIIEKAWTEMVHRYFAGSLGMIILILAVWAAKLRRWSAQHSIVVPWLLVALVLFQAMLGMWTVTWKLLPLVVTAHLLGGMLIACLLWWLTLETNSFRMPNLKINSLRPWAILAALLIFLQIFLGAWTSTNYAALACPHFPHCYDSFFPAANWHAAFNFTSPIGPDYEGGQLAMDARVAIQMTHRYGAFIVASYVAPFALVLIFSQQFAQFRRLGLLLLLLLCSQIGLGIMNVVFSLPMSTAMAHNGVGALLLLTAVTVVKMTSAVEKPSP